MIKIMDTGDNDTTKARKEIKRPNSEFLNKKKIMDPGHKEMTQKITQ